MDRDTLTAKLAKLTKESATRAAERDLRAFIPQAWAVLEPDTPFVPNWHLDAIADHLMGVTEGQIRQLVINIPPRHTKSMTTSVIWPAWEWGPRRLPQIRSIFASYGLALAIRDAVYSRRLIESAFYQERWGSVFALTTDQNVKSRYENDHAGFRMAGSFDSGITGEGGHKIVADDPHDLNDADNPKALERAIEVYTGTLASRLNDPQTGARVIIMQRVSERDLAAHVLKAGGWTHLMLPAEYDPRRSCVTVGSVRPVVRDGETVYQPQAFTDPRTEEGALLWPDRFGPEEVAALKSPSGVGLRRFGGQYNQDPAPSAATIFPRQGWKFWTLLPEKFDELIQSWDMAFKDLTSSDYVTGGVWGRLGANFYLVHQLRQRLSFSGTVAAVEALSGRYPRAHRKLVEDKANGSAVINVLKDKIPGLLAVNPQGGKVARANAVQPYHQAGNLYLPHPTDARVLVPDPSWTPDPNDPDATAPLLEEPYDASWVDGFIEECQRFPAGAHDDQVDQMTQAIIHFSGKARPRIRSLA